MSPGSGVLIKMVLKKNLPSPVNRVSRSSYSIDRVLTLARYRFAFVFVSSISIRASSTHYSFFLNTCLPAQECLLSGVIRHASPSCVPPVVHHSLLASYLRALYDRRSGWLRIKISLSFLLFFDLKHILKRHIGANWYRNEVLIDAGRARSNRSIYLYDEGLRRRKRRRIFSLRQRDPDRFSRSMGAQRSK